MCIISFKLNLDLDRLSQVHVENKTKTNRYASEQLRSLQRCVLPFHLRFIQAADLCYVFRGNLLTMKQDKGFKRRVWVKGVNMTSYTLPLPLPSLKQ